MTADMDKLAASFKAEVESVIVEEKPTTRCDVLAITPMTVAQLRAALDGMPDDAPVHVQSYVPYAGDDTKRGGMLVHAEGLQSEVTGISVLLWSAERASDDPGADRG